MVLIDTWMDGDGLWRGDRRAADIQEGPSVDSSVWVGVIRAGVITRLNHACPRAAEMIGYGNVGLGLLETGLKRGKVFITDAVDLGLGSQDAFIEEFFLVETGDGLARANIAVHKGLREGRFV